MAARAVEEGEAMVIDGVVARGVDVESEVDGVPEAVHADLGPVCHELDGAALAADEVIVAVGPNV